MTQSEDLPSRLNRAEDNIIDLRLAVSATLQAIDKNSSDIAALIEASRRNSEAISGLLEISRRNSESIAQHSESIAQHSESIARIDEAIRSINASTERMDRLLDYLIRRDRDQSE